MPASVLVCFALAQEARFLRIPNSVDIVVDVLLTGIGRTNTAQAVGPVLDRVCPDLLLTCGFAGGLRPGLRVGSVLFAGKGAGNLPEILCALGARPGSFHCASQIVVRAEEKLALWKSTGADAVEMESEFINQICHRHSIPSATIRVISDAAEEDLPLEFNALMTPNQEIDYGKLAWAVLRAPKAVPGLLRFHRQTNTAARQLGGTVTELLRRWRPRSG